MKPDLRPALAGAVTFALGLVLAGVAALSQAQRNQADAAERFDILARSVVADVAARMQTLEYGLRGARGVVVAAAGERLRRDAFRRYAATRDIDREFTGARGFGVIRRVAQSDEPAFVAEARRDGWPDFAIRQLAPHDGERYVIEYIEPVERNRQAIGLDVASEENRRSAAQASMRSGAAALTAPITLVQASSEPSRSFLLMLPIYRPGAPLDSVEQREAAAIGWSYAPIVIDEVLQSLTDGRAQYTLALRDRYGPDALRFYASPGSDRPAAGELKSVTAMPMFGRTWEAELHATPAFVQGLKQTAPQQVALAIAMVGALCAALATALARLAVRKRSELTAQARRAAFVDASDDAIIGETMGGVVTDWNAGAERLFGYPASFALGRSSAELLLPPGQEADDIAVRAAIARGEHVAAFDSVRRHRDGTLVEVSVMAAPIVTPDGGCIGLVTTLHDVRDARRSRQALAELNAELEGLVIDRTARLDAALRDLRSILDAVPSMIGYWDRHLVNRVANRAYGDWFGLEPQSLPGKTMRELLGDELFERNRPLAEAALRGERQTFERDIPRPDGRGVRPSLAHYLPDVVDGEVRGFYVLVHDVSELVEGRLKLAAVQRDNDALLRTIHQHAIVSVADRSGRITDVNDSFCAISGYGRDELLGQDHRILNSGHHDKSFWVGMWRSIASGTAWRGEVCNRAKNGSLYWVNSIVAPFVGADGKIEKYISIRNDITDAKLAEQRLRSSEAALHRAGQIAGVGGWELDLRTKVVSWTAHTRQLHEVEPDYVPTLEGGLSFYPPQARAAIEAATVQAIQRGTPCDLELPFVTARGRSIWVRVLGTAEFEDGRAVRLVGALQDITARKRAEATLAYERQLMSSLLDTLPDQIYFKDRDSRFLRINPALARRYGLADPADAVGKSDADFFTEAHALGTALIERQIVDTGEAVIDLEEQETWPDRAPTWNLSTKMPLRDTQGRVIGTFGISRDITSRKLMEEELQLTNRRFSLAADSVGLGVWEYDVVQRTLVWDDRMYELYGRHRGAQPEPYALWIDCLHPDDRVRGETEILAAIEGVRPYDTLFRVMLPDGSVRHLRAAAHTVRDAEGRALRMTGVCFDVTERERAEAELRQAMTMLNAVLDSATQASIIAVKPDGLVSVFNAGAQKMLGYRSEDVVGRENSLLFHDRDEMRQRAQSLSEQLGRKVATSMVLVDPAMLGQAQEWSYRRKDGSLVPVSLAITAMHGERGELFGYVGIAHDVSRQKEQERSLREAVHRANQANRAKSQFLANMSHEIRTPMNAVIGLSYLLERTTLDAEQAATLAKIKLASKSLLGIINDVLDLSKIEAAEMRIERAPFSLERLLGELSQLMAMQAEAKGIAFAVEIAEQLPAAVEGDATRLHQVLTNLLSNAIKFTERGGVQLQVRQVRASAESLRLRFVAQDTGIGIPAEALERLFRPFVQADTSTTRRFGGTGLGLSIVKQLVTLMGGEIDVSSRPGVGSEFGFELEFPVCDATQLLPDAEGSKPAAGLHGVRVLVVDDSTINLEVARRILELEGAMVWLAVNGQEAVEYLLTIPHAVDVVLMDVQMPVLDGHDATRRIRNGLGLTRLPIIALTAGISSGEHERATAAGMNDVLSKPFDPPALVHCIRRHLRLDDGPAAAPPRSAPATPAVPEGWPSIAGVDARDAAMRLGGDVALFRSMLRRLLRDFGDLGAAAVEPAALDALAGRMHNLKGSAGTIGAKAIESLAAQAEAACRAHDETGASSLMRRLAAELQNLASDGATLLQVSDDPGDADQAGSGAELDVVALTELLRQLKDSDLRAIDGFARLSAQLRPRLGPDSYATLREQIDNLQFVDAARVLEEQF